MLKACQKGGHVITARATKVNTGNVNVAEFTMGHDNMSHRSDPVKIDEYEVKKGPETSESQ